MKATVNQSTLLRFVIQEKDGPQWETVQTTMAIKIALEMLTIYRKRSPDLKYHIVEVKTQVIEIASKKVISK